MSNPIPAGHAVRLARARCSLEGLSLGDAFGQQFFSPSTATRAFMTKTPPLPPWHTTDDSEMAVVIYDLLSRYGRIEQDDLARQFARRYAASPDRGYGHGTIKILRAVGAGEDWRQASAAAFGGEGSMGNGAAMRVAPLGAYFADDLQSVVREADASAEITHRHADARAGAIAVAVAAGWASQWQAAGGKDDPRRLIEMAATHTPDGVIREGLHTALQLGLDEWEFTAAQALGNGSRVMAADTVPFCLWCAAKHLQDFEAALWTAVRVGGDMDTTAAIVGGIVALAVGQDRLPKTWLAARESVDFASE